MKRKAGTNVEQADVDEYAAAQQTETSQEVEIR
jgi:hypothetical protein